MHALAEFLVSTLLLVRASVPGNPIAMLHIANVFLAFFFHMKCLRGKLRSKRISKREDRAHILLYVIK